MAVISHHEDTSSRVTNSSNLMAEEDLISKLPEDIIISIVSRLDTIEQQAKTSVLARRWRYLWTFSATNLVFVRRYGGRRSEFICHVNQVIAAAKATSSTNIGTFNLELYGADDKEVICQHHIDEWLNLVLQKKVKRINLHLWLGGERVYSLINSPVMSRIRNQSLVLDSLTSLRLCWVDVSGEVLEYILYSASPLLEELLVIYPGPSPVKFTVSGWSLKLKHLEFCCFDIYRSSQYLHIHDVNLVSLKFTGDGNCLTIRDTPHLVEVCGSSDMNFASRILSKLPQLETLVWTPCPLVRGQPSIQLCEFPTLRNLKQLELIVFNIIFCVRFCALLLDASPLLSEFKIRFHRFPEPDKEDKVSRLKHPHQSLKVVEIFGFIGCEFDLGVALYLIKNVASLETMIINTQPLYGMRKDPNKQQAARARARMRLEPILSPRTRMVFN